MSYMEKAFQAFNQNNTGNIHTCFPASVISYNQGNKRAVIQPLFAYEIDGQEVTYPQIQNVPVMYQKEQVQVVQTQTTTVDNHTHTTSEGSTTTGPAGTHSHNVQFITQTVSRVPILEPGDVVVCVCAEKSIDAAEEKKVHKPLSERQYDIADAIIIGVLY